VHYSPHFSRWPTVPPDSAKVQSVLVDLIESRREVDADLLLRSAARIQEEGQVFKSERGKSDDPLRVLNDYKTTEVSATPGGMLNGPQQRFGASRTSFCEEEPSTVGPWFDLLVSSTKMLQPKRRQDVAAPELVVRQVGSCITGGGAPWLCSEAWSQPTGGNPNFCKQYEKEKNAKELALKNPRRERDCWTVAL
jgi:hypothetical protein